MNETVRVIILNTIAIYEHDLLYYIIFTYFQFLNWFLILFVADSYS